MKIEAAQNSDWTWGMPVDPSMLDDGPDGKLDAYV